MSWKHAIVVTTHHDKHVDQTEVPAFQNTVPARVHLNLLERIPFLTLEINLEDWALVD